MSQENEQPDPPFRRSLDEIEAQIEEMESQYLDLEAPAGESDQRFDTRNDSDFGPTTLPFDRNSVRAATSHSNETQQTATLSPSDPSNSKPAEPNPSGNKTAESPLGMEPGTQSLVVSTLLSLLVVLVLLGTIRLVLPTMLEYCRYGWAKGQLRAEYEMAGERLQKVSLDGLADVSRLIGQRVSPSVVHIDLRRSRKEKNAKGPFGLLENMRVEQGSGVIVDPRGYVITNHHVIESDGTIEVQMSDGRIIPAEVVGVDPVTDLAVLKIEGAPLLAIDWGDSDLVSVGTPVWAVGSPFGLTGSVTFGILSGKHRIDLSTTRLQGSLKSQAEYSDLMQSDVAVNPGNSGGPLVNAQGELIGINTAIIGEHYRGVSFSIPSNVVKKVYEKLLTTGKMDRGVLGILIDEDYHPKRTGEGIVGVRIKNFVPDSPGKKAGLLVNDIIVRVADSTVEDLRDLRRIVGEAYIGSNVEVIASRNGEELSFQVMVGPFLK